MKEKTKTYTLKSEIRSRFGRKWNGTVLSTAGRFLSGAHSSCLMFVAILYCIIWRKILNCFTQTSIAFRSLPLFRQSLFTLYSFIIACEQDLRVTRKKETSLLTGYVKMDFFFRTTIVQRIQQHGTQIIWFFLSSDKLNCYAVSFSHVGYT